MSDSFKAWLISEAASGQSTAFTELTQDDLMDGDVTVRILASTVNYKDGLALTGKAPIVRRFPLIPGIDFAGEVIASAHPEFAVGERVVLTGWGVGESHHGGFAELARVNGDWLVPLPESLSPSDAMAVGTAGFTAMLAVIGLEELGLTPDGGEVVVTGAAGGVGGVAIVLLAGLGYTVVASTGRPGEAAYLKALGASEVIGRETFAGSVRPLARARWAGAIDVAGSTTLANLLSQMAYGGAVAACGLAEGLDLPATVAPFILRGVTLRGIDSVMCPAPRRRAAWRRIEQTLDRDKLSAMTTHIPLSGVADAAERILAGQVRGRLVVDVAT